MYIYVWVIQEEGMHTHTHTHHSVRMHLVCRNKRERKMEIIKVYCEMMDVSRYCTRIAFSSTHPASQPSTTTKTRRLHWGKKRTSNCIFSNFSTTHTKFHFTIFLFISFLFLLLLLLLLLLVVVVALLFLFLFVHLLPFFLYLFIFDTASFHVVSFRFVCVHCHFPTRSLSIFHLS